MSVILCPAPVGGVALPSLPGIRISPPVQALLMASRPAAIRGRIGAVVVDTIQRFPFRSRIHVSQEILEGSPSLADGDSAPTVMLIAGGLRVGAALNHREPRTVDRCRNVARVCVPMLGDTLLLETTTTQMLSSLQIRGLGKRDLTAVTLAHPYDLRPPIGATTKRNQAPETLSDEIGNLPHNTLRCLPDYSRDWRIM